MDQRPDDNNIMEAISGKYSGAKALVILGGLSAVNWLDVKNKIHPDLLIGVNGVNGVIQDLDFWLCAENMLCAHKMAVKQKSARHISLMEMYQRTGAKIRLVNWKSHSLIKDKTNLLLIKRNGIDDPSDPSDFSIRKYGNGLMTGDIYKDDSKASVTLRTGTVGLQTLHLAGLLGCAEVHTIGFDLCFKGAEHHWYVYPSYEIDEVWTEQAFVSYKGLNTIDWWIKTAGYLKRIEPLLQSEGLKWIDHSGGLLTAEGLNCANYMI